MEPVAAVRLVDFSGVRWSDVMVRNEVDGEFTAEFPELKPTTEFGRQLLALRAKVVASATPRLDWDGIQQEVAERRGGVRHCDE